MRSLGVTCSLRLLQLAAELSPIQIAGADVTRRVASVTERLAVERQGSFASRGIISRKAYNYAMSTLPDFRQNLPTSFEPARQRSLRISSVALLSQTKTESKESGPL